MNTLTCNYCIGYVTHKKPRVIWLRKYYNYNAAKSWMTLKYLELKLRFNSISHVQFCDEAWGQIPRFTLCFGLLLLF